MRTDRVTIWLKSHDPAQHFLWNLWFTDIEYLLPPYPRMTRPILFTTHSECLHRHTL